jgi:hypothetical protein
MAADFIVSINVFCCIFRRTIGTGALWRLACHEVLDCPHPATDARRRTNPFCRVALELVPEFARAEKTEQAIA